MPSMEVASDSSLSADLTHRSPTPDALLLPSCISLSLSLDAFWSRKRKQGEKPILFASWISQPERNRAIVGWWNCRRFLERLKLRENYINGRVAMPGCPLMCRHTALNPLHCPFRQPNDSVSALRSSETTPTMEIIPAPAAAH